MVKSIIVAAIENEWHCLVPRQNKTVTLSNEDKHTTATFRGLSSTLVGTHLKPVTADNNVSRVSKMFNFIAQVKRLPRTCFDRYSAFTLADPKAMIYTIDSAKRQ